jgi:hypothetical protein
VPVKRTLRHTGLAITLGLSLLVGTTGVANAESAAKGGAAACPVSGQRFQVGSDTRVYLVGPDRVLYAIANETVYFKLWNTWDGISRWPTTTIPSCFRTAYLWTDAWLRKGRNDPAVYIWDQRESPNGAYRWITSSAVFNKYAFAPNKIVVSEYGPPISSTNNWDH